MFFDNLGMFHVCIYEGKTTGTSKILNAEDSSQLPLSSKVQASGYAFLAKRGGYDDVKVEVSLEIINRETEEKVRVIPIENPDKYFKYIELAIEHFKKPTRFILNARNYEKRECKSCNLVSECKKIEPLKVIEFWKKERLGEV